MASLTVKHETFCRAAGFSDQGVMHAADMLSRSTKSPLLTTTSRVFSCSGDSTGTRLNAVTILNSELNQ